MIKKILIFLKQPFPLDLSFSHTLKTVGAVSLFVFLFLFIFQPFGIQDELVQPLFLITLGYGIITFIVGLINRLVIPRLFPALFQETKWSIMHEIGDSLWNIFSIGLANTIYAGTTSHHLDDVGILIVLHMIGLTLLVSIGPIILFVSFEYNRQLKKHLKQAALMNHQIESMHHENQNKSIVTLNSEIGNDEITIDLNTLLYIKSIENYIQIFWLEADRTKQALLRSSLTRVENNLKDFDSLFRCHRTYLVHLGQVRSIEGNSQGYKLAIPPSEELIPVSRGNVKQLQKKLGVQSLKKAPLIPRKLNQ